jgi:hypothetical protein
MQEVPLSYHYCPAPPTTLLLQPPEAMPKVTSLFLALMILQLLLYSYILVLELPPRFTKASLKGAPTLRPPSSDADPPGCTSAVSTPSEAEASEAFAPAADVVAPEELEDELIELGHAFLDHLAQLNFSSGPPS